jgi:hypothetical protein
VRSTEDIRRYQKEWRRRNPDYNKQYRIKNPRPRLTNAPAVPKADPEVHRLLRAWGAVGMVPTGWPHLVIDA